MSIISTIKAVVAKIAGKSTAAAAVVTIVETDAQKLVAFLKTTSVGAAAVQMVKDATALTNADGTAASGAAKFEKVVADVLPVLITFLTDKGALEAELASIEDVARELVQSAFNDVVSQAKGILKGLLSLLGIS